MPAFALTLPQILPLVVYAIMLVSLGLIVFVPFFPGVAVIFVTLAAFVGYSSYLAHDLAGITPLAAGLVVLFSVAGMFSTFWSEKLGLRYTYVSQQVMWGAIVGSLVLGMVLGGMLWFMLGMLVGAIAMEVREGRPFGDAVRTGVAAIYSMLGPRGFQLLMALLVIDAGMPRFAMPIMHLMR